MDTRTERLMYLFKHAQEEFGKDYLVMAMPGFLVRKFVAYCSMKEDIELLLNYVDILKEKQSAIISSGLSYALISLYGKCFTDASKHSNPKLEASDLFKDQEQHSKTHAYLMDLRHQFIAHRGETDSEVGIAYLIIPKEGDVDQSQVRFSQLKQIAFTNDLERIENLLRFILDRVMEKVNTSGQKAHEGLFNLFTPEQLRHFI